MKKTKIRKVIALVMAVAFVALVPAQAKAEETATVVTSSSTFSELSEKEFVTPSRSVLRSSTIAVAAYTDSGFYSQSAPEYVILQLSSDALSLYATCDTAETSYVTFKIEEVSTGNICDTFDFPADGTVYTYLYNLPAGRYRCYFLSPDAETDASAVFSRNE